jgi:hypothetical protein
MAVTPCKCGTFNNLRLARTCRGRVGEPKKVSMRKRGQRSLTYAANGADPPSL